MSPSEEIALAAGVLARMVEHRDTTDARTALWDDLRAQGLTHPFQAGADDWRLGAALVRESGRQALGIHLAENIVASWLLAQTGTPCSGERLTLADPTRSSLRLHDGRVAGDLLCVPHASLSSHVLAGAHRCGDAGDTTGEPVLVLLEVLGAVGRAGSNVAGEPRDDLRLEAAPAIVCARGPAAVAALTAMGALMRAGQLLGLAEWVLDASVAHVRTREQFGKPLSAFQAVRQLLAELAGEVAAAQMAVSLADAAVATHSKPGLEGMAQALPAIATAQCQAADLCEAALRVGHQLHGAMGYTREHALHARSLRLMSYRGEFGHSELAARWLGQRALRLGAQRLWPDLSEEKLP